MSNKEHIESPLVNRVAQSGLVTINLENFYPDVEIVSFDMKDHLFMELILKEKDFRAALKSHNWEQYQGKTLLVYCSTDAIIPVWAFMLVTAYAEPYASEVFTGDEQAYLAAAFDKKLQGIEGSEYQDKRIVIKGCSDKEVPVSAYVKLTTMLRPYAQSIMYGEPCSTVPIFKRPRTIQKRSD
jgi:protease II